MKVSPHKHLFPIIDAMVDQAITDVENDGQKISCRAGCTHCCYLLIEISKEEAVELAEWTSQQLPAKSQQIIARVVEAATNAKELFSRRKESEQFTKPQIQREDIPDVVFDEYFYETKRPVHI
ncbi:MAG: hypothetical protein R3A13_09720 [Bdellovibrionota bacterium]